MKLKQDRNSFERLNNLQCYLIIILIIIQIDGYIGDKNEMSLSAMHETGRWTEHIPMNI